MNALDSVKNLLYTAFDIFIQGFACAFLVMMGAIFIQAIYQQQGLEGQALVGSVLGLVIGLFIAFSIVAGILNAIAVNQVRLNGAFWLMASLVGGVITTEYITNPYMIIPLQTTLFAALLIAGPAWLWHLSNVGVERFVHWLETDEEKRKRTAALDVDVSRLVDDVENSLALKPDAGEKLKIQSR